MDKRFLAILAALAIIFLGIAVASKNSGDSNGSSGNDAQPTSHIKGEGQANVTLLEYGDYQCPVCQAFYQPLEEVAAKYSKDIRFQFRNLPLTSIHPNAFAAARAAEAAAMQNKFWEMHGMLYQISNWQAWTQSNSSRAIFEGYAKQLGLDEQKFKTDYASDRVNDLINADLAAFEKTNQQMSTPAIFLNGRYIENTQLLENGRPSVEKISALIEAEIAKARQ